MKSNINKFGITYSGSNNKISMFSVNYSWFLTKHLRIIHDPTTRISLRKHTKYNVHCIFSNLHMHTHVEATTFFPFIKTFTFPQLEHKMQTTHDFSPNILESFTIWQQESLWGDTMCIAYFLFYTCILVWRQPHFFLS